MAFLPFTGGSGTKELGINPHGLLSAFFTGCQLSDSDPVASHTLIGEMTVLWDFLKAVKAPFSCIHEPKKNWGFRCLQLISMAH